MAMGSFGQDVNQQGASQYARGSIEFPELFFNAIVEDIVTNETGGKVLKYAPDGRNLGEILFRALPQDRNLDIKKLESAFPISNAVMQFPLVGEQVLVLKTVGGLYYLNRINTSNRVSDSISATLKAAAQPKDEAAAVAQRKLAQVQVTVPPVATDALGNEFIRNVTTKNIRASEGDTVIQGRYGNTIRLGSSLFKTPGATNVSPNIILTAGQWDSPKELSTDQPTDFSAYFENINHDKSSIWMIGDQEVPFLGATAHSTSKQKCHLASSERPPAKYTGAQIFVNSDRVVLNSKKNEISLFSKTEINLSAMKSITLDTESSIFLRANKSISIIADKDITLQASQLTISATKDLSYITSGNYSITGKKIFIGRYGDTGQPMVLGATLSLWLQSVLKLLTIPGAIQTLSGPAIFNPGVLAALKQLQNQLGSEVAPQRAIFNSKDNFTSETNLT